MQKAKTIKPNLGGFELKLTILKNAFVSFSFFLTLSQTSPGFTCLQYKSFENTVGKGEIAR